MCRNVKTLFNLEPQGHRRGDPGSLAAVRAHALGLHAAQALAAALPNAAYCSLSGQTHDIVPEALAPVLEEFFTG
jgi:hypothetical protein